jgi:very-short-patch-repair endonuclease
MRKCELCEEEFETVQAKANHVRWHHKNVTFSDDGLRRIREGLKRTNELRFGMKSQVTEKRTCICGAEFTVTFSPERYHKGRKTCSKACAAKRTMSEQGRESLRQFHRNNPNVWINKGIQSNNNSRFSSKAERQLASALAEHGFKRHHIVRTQDLTFDVDIVSLDKMIWIESDGSWHFRKVHEKHNYEATKFRDRLEEQEALFRNVLLIRVNNETTSVDEQIEFVLNEVTSWDRLTGKVIKFGYYDEESEGTNYMSASAELLVERIRELTKAMNEASDRGESVESYKVQLVELNKQLATATKALNENKQLLKG